MEWICHGLSVNTSLHWYMKKQRNNIAIRNKCILQGQGITSAQFQEMGAVKIDKNQDCSFQNCSLSHVND
jgi:hypothetical protein